MPTPKKSMDHAVLNLIELLERQGLLKLSAHRFRKKAPARKVQYQPDELVPSQQAAEILRVSAKTLANWRVSGTGPAFIKSGRLVTYRHNDLQAFVARRRRTSTSDLGSE